MDPPGARVRILMTVKPNQLWQRNGPLSIHIYETEFFLSTITKVNKHTPMRCSLPSSAR